MKKNYKSTVNACFAGYVVQSIVNNFVPLLFLTFNKSYGIELSKITALITVNFILQLIIDLLSAFFIDKIGYRTAAVAAHVFAAAGLVSLTVLPDILPSPFVGLLISVMLYAVGGGLLEVIVSPIVEACPTDNKEKMMSLLHSFYCWGSVAAVGISTLFFALFSDNGPVNAVLLSMGWIKTPISFLNTVWGNRGLVGLMNFLMWFGNTTIMLMAAIMGVDPTLYEAAELDGCTPNQMFWKITIPLIRPILVYVMITSMIGGLQMFDVPQILTNGKGGPDRTSTTMIMYLNNHLFSKNYGMAGAVSVVLFLVCARKMTA